MNPQEVFETVSRHLFSQGHQSLNTFGACLYRGLKGEMCAVGVLIPDEVYTEDMEYKRIGSLIADHSDKLPDYIHDNMYLLSDLQEVHDYRPNWLTGEKMQIALMNVGTDHGLSIEFLDTCYFGMAK